MHVPYSCLLNHLLPAHTTANKWARLNKKGTLPAATTAAAATAAAAASSSTVASTDSPADRAGPLGTAPAGGTPKLTKLPSYSDRGLPSDTGVVSDSTSSSSNFPAAQRLSNYLLVALQYWGLGPGVLLCSLLLLREIRVNVLGQVGREQQYAPPHWQKHGPTSQSAQATDKQPTEDMHHFTLQLICHLPPSYGFVSHSGAATGTSHSCNFTHCGAPTMRSLACSLGTLCSDCKH